MKRIKKTVFISYRRANGPWALAIYQYLKTQGFDVFFDFLSIGSGNFERIITENIEARAHFLILLTPSALDGCENPNDWLRREIEIAIDNKRNIVPVLLEGFDFSEPDILKYLSGKLEMLKYYNGIRLYLEYFEEAMRRLCNQYLNIELDAVTHPVSSDVERVVEKHQEAIELEPKVGINEIIAQGYFEIGYQAKDIDEKIRYYSRVIELVPLFPYAYNNRGNNYGALGQHERAIEDFDKAIELNPEDADYYSNRGTR